MTKSIKKKIIIIYNITVFVAAIIMYYMIPFLLNYGPGTINTAFDKEVSGGLMFYQQILLVLVCVSVVLTVVLSIILKDIDKYKIYKQQYDEGNLEAGKKLNHIKKICFRLPNLFLISFIIIPIILELFILFQQLYTSNSDFKLVLILFIISVIALSFANIFVKKILTKVLYDLENAETFNVKKKGVTHRILLQNLPLIAVSIVFTFLLVSAFYEQNKGQTLAKFYTLQFRYLNENHSYQSKDEIINSLADIELSENEDILFLIDNNWNYIYQTGEISDFFKKYSAEFSLANNNLVYDFYGTYTQGVIFPIEVDGQTWYLGASYYIYSNEMFNYMIPMLVILFFSACMILFYFAKELSSEIKTVVTSLKSINNNKELDRQLAITSTDEIGELVREYNNIRELTKKNIEQIHSSQDILIERERLASLGQMIGGIAHNLKTPIMSISGAAEGLTDLIKEYDSSISDPDVTPEDHHDIAKDMQTWVDKVKDYTGYMSDVITAVKGQAVTLSNEQAVTFTIEELVKHVNILMKHELKNALTSLNVAIQVDPALELKGNINSLVQVINNMISNSIQSYNGKPDSLIDMNIFKQGQELIIGIRDYGSGLPKEVKEKLFKEMITTKGKDGTGLGLFMSYSNIRAHFNGNITFESEEGKGTTFYIHLPM